MKKLNLFLLVILILPVAVFAQEQPQSDVIDQAIQIALAILAGIPVVGPYLAIGLKALGVIAVVLTSVSAVLMSMAAAFNMVGLSKAADLIGKFLPYVKKASMFNQQKPQ